MEIDTEFDGNGSLRSTAREGHGEDASDPPNRAYMREEVFLIILTNTSPEFRSYASEFFETTRSKTMFIDTFIVDFGSFGANRSANAALESK